MKTHRIDHVGIVVNDFPAAKAFFLDFGLEMQGGGRSGRRVGGADSRASRR
jgi:catechol 2,3-dioxygenase-like lactoylglutathione lyase family enzyme